MKKIIKTLSLLGIGILALSACDKKEEAKTNTWVRTTETTTIKTFEITFKNYDGTILQQSTYKEGIIPEYKGETPTRESDSNYSYKFKGWDSFISMAVENKTYIAQYEQVAIPYVRIDNKIYFGSYPQELEGDESKILSLNSQYNSLQSWNIYNYYYENSPKTFMYYKDIDLDLDGKYDYRGVCFNSYRPYNINHESIESMTYQDENEFELNTKYWFKYQPIEWDILKEYEGDEALIITNMMIDSQEFYLKCDEDKFDHNGGNGYSNNYELSNIRIWLNQTFYENAFSTNDKKIINTKTVNNSQTPSKYSSNNTEDKIKLLSIEEYEFYYKEEEKAKAKGTGYAKSQGLWVNTSIVNTGYSEWMLRTASYNCDYNFCTVDSAGTVNGNGQNVSKTCYGIRPALWIKL